MIVLPAGSLVPVGTAALQVAPPSDPSLYTLEYLTYCGHYAMVQKP